MTEKTEVLPSFDGIDFDDGELDTEHITLARAIEEARTARDSTLELKREIEAELKVFRDAMSRELRARKRKIDLQDALLFLGLGAASTGIAVAFHWAYSLIFVGSTFMTLSFIPFLRTPIKPG